LQHVAALFSGPCPGLKRKFIEELRGNPAGEIHGNPAAAAVPLEIYPPWHIEWKNGREFFNA